MLALAFMSYSVNAGINAGIDAGISASVYRATKPKARPKTAGRHNHPCSTKGTNTG